MGPELLFQANVVDPTRNRVESLEASLQKALPDRYVAAGYDSTNKLLDTLTSNPWRVPLVVVADSAARTPNVEEGVFARVKRLVPRCRSVFFSASMQERDTMDRLRLVDRVVGSTWENPLSALIDAVLDAIRSFEDTVEFALITQFAEKVRKAEHGDESVVDDGEGPLSPRRMLIEMARGTARGRRYLLAMHPEVDLIQALKRTAS
ncbi:MAG TPA: hypothetical protein VMY37_41030 [Thermoguttaceae bacterium]|nr:hypothetical protein [Thermoguttaceae bacterium]